MFILCLLVVTAFTLGPQAVKGQIVGGQDASVGEFPYQVILKDSGRHFASGCLISLKHVLTCGHCVDRPGTLASLSAHVGTNDLQSEGIRYNIINKLVYTQHRVSADIDYWWIDIGIFTLNSDVTLSNVVDIGTLPDRNCVEINAEATVSGSGVNNVHEKTHSRFLQKLTVMIIDNNLCKILLPPQFGGIDENHICSLVEQGKGPSFGDSGAPLVQNGFIIGIAYSVVLCGTLGYPDIYTNVFSQITWINEIIES